MMNGRVERFDAARGRGCQRKEKKKKTHSLIQLLFIQFCLCCALHKGSFELSEMRSSRTEIAPVGFQIAMRSFGRFHLLQTFLLLPTLLSNCRQLKRVPVFVEPRGHRFRKAVAAPPDRSSRIQFQPTENRFTTP